MVYVRDGSAAKLFRELGGANTTPDHGDVIVEMISPPKQVRLPTTAVEIFDLGALLTLPDDRRVYVPTSNISSIADVPAQPETGSEAGASAGDGRPPGPAPSLAGLSDVDVS